uniref:Uncharacterized protein n=1 Tax=Triticum urartu TaxID=4572 RepID=A0A8R7U671_TRIUA
MNDGHWMPSPMFRSTTCTCVSPLVASRMAWLAVKCANLANGDSSCIICCADILSDAGGSGGEQLVLALEIRDRRPWAKW